MTVKAYKFAAQTAFPNVFNAFNICGDPEANSKSFQPKDISKTHQGQTEDRVPSQNEPSHTEASAGMKVERKVEGKAGRKESTHAEAIDSEGIDTEGVDTKDISPGPNISEKSVKSA